MSLTVPVTRLSHLNLRAELRLALLAAAESCWIYAFTVTLGALAGFPREVSPVGIFIVYWAGLLAGRVLPHRRRAWRALQLLTILVGLVSVFIAVRVGLYGDLPLLEPTWVVTYVQNALAFFERTTPEEISTVALIFAFVRGLSFAGRPLTLWQVGYEFRLGIVFFLVAAGIGALTTGANFIPWIFVYFAVSLIAISLARIEEAGQERPLGWKWAVVLGAFILATMFLGLIVTRIFTLNTVNAFFQLLSPLDAVLALIVTIIAIPVFFILSILINLLAPLFSALAQRIGALLPNLQLPPPDTRQLSDTLTKQFAFLLPFLRVGGIVLVVALVGLLVARALKRRMNVLEDEQFVQEPADDIDGLELEQRKRRAAAQVAPREIHAENVRRIYAALLAQAEAMGLPRREAETPLEFLPRLTARFPESAAPLRQLTDAYVAVHYAQHPATDAQVHELRDVWRQLKQHMEAERRKTKSEHQN